MADEGTQTEIKDIGAFAKEIAVAASLPREQRGDADFVFVRCGVFELPYRGGEVHYFENVALVDSGVRGMDCEIRDSVVYREVGSHMNEDGAFNWQDQRKNFLSYLVGKIKEHNPRLNILVLGDQTFAVESIFSQYAHKQKAH